LATKSASASGCISILRPLEKTKINKIRDENETHIFYVFFDESISDILFDVFFVESHEDFMTFYVQKIRINF